MGFILMPAQCTIYGILQFLGRDSCQVKLSVQLVDSAVRVGAGEVDDGGDDDTDGDHNKHKDEDDVGHVNGDSYDNDHADDDHDAVDNLFDEENEVDDDVADENDDDTYADDT
jgi:hypothetical protein